jgi:hypothetical protein
MVEVEDEATPGRQVTLSNLRWYPWHRENLARFEKSKGSAGPGEAMVVEELRLHGYQVDVQPGNARTFDLLVDEGLRIEVKSPDASGRIITARNGILSLSWLLDECRRVLDLGVLLWASEDQIAYLREALAVGQLGREFWLRMGEVVGDTHRSLGGRRGLVTSLHEWISDPTVYIADVHSVMASEAMQCEVLFLVSREGFSMIPACDLDRRVVFSHEVWGMRPKFRCPYATRAVRRDMLAATLKDIEDGSCDKIVDMALVMTLGASTE